MKQIDKSPSLVPATAARREFHLARVIRDQVRLDDSLFALEGNLIIINQEAARQMVKKFAEISGENWSAAQLAAMGLIDEILHYVVGRYLEQVKPTAVAAALEHLDSEFGQAKIDAALSRFLTDFPPTDIYNSTNTVDKYLSDSTNGLPNRVLALEELVLHWLANLNPAFESFQPLFDDQEMETATGYRRLMDDILTFFSTQPPYGPKLQNLIEMLREPARVVPHSLSGQLQYMHDNWGDLLGPYLLRLLRGLDFMAEEDKFRGLGPGEIPVPVYGSGDEEYERFSPDSDWMPRVVMIAKNTLVWLDQLSRKYDHPIYRLDEIPDEELDKLADYGFTALWLIGLWERSEVSQKIKQWCGNPEAEASAYALKRYVIADRLGGPNALENLKIRCRRRGIRLASDMVPNHTGLDADWLIEHPDWYVQNDQPPFHGYQFESGNLSDDDRIEVRIEDHYYQRSDAAVVFQYRKDGHTRYVYHGNDGTSMPWNDTAQLNYLLPEVRETVIQTILHVARQTPIIRFDAAMTLAKRHFQRLWFPEPGSGGDIPSRAERGLTKEEFNRVFPQEFWREVVDRVAEEVPHTLLLAEAFWMMESYFVRTLGMHRVYNSAFMNMLKMEDNAKYRQTIKNTIEFDPQVLKRFVNFLNNPDEETAAVQFGTGDKYFGVTLLMLTMPGLPMLGHGQIEGYREKYGMEFSKAYWDEHPDQDLIDRHRRDIFPVMRKRYLFAEVENFRLFDLYQQDGSVNENVFAYTNQTNEQTLTLYNNAYEQASGWLRQSAAFNERPGDAPQLRQVSLAEALELPYADDCFLIFREHVSGLEFIRCAVDIHRQGMAVNLDGYQYQIFWEIRQVWDGVQGQYRRLHDTLNGAGAPNIDEALKDLFLRPVREAFTTALEKTDKTAIEEFIESVRQHLGGELPTEPVTKRIFTEIDSPIPGSLKFTAVDKATINIWRLVRFIGKVIDTEDWPRHSRRLIDELGLDAPMGAILAESGMDTETADRQILLIGILCRFQQHLTEVGDKEARQLFRELLDDGQVHRFLGINSFGGIIWFNQEGFRDLVRWLEIITNLQLPIDSHAAKTATDICQTWRDAEESSDYQVEKLLSALEKNSHRGTENAEKNRILNI